VYIIYQREQGRGRLDRRIGVPVGGPKDKASSKERQGEREKKQRGRARSGARVLVYNACSNGFVKWEKPKSNTSGGETVIFD